MRSSVFIIAEAGVNHNGDIETARQMIDAAVNAGADAVKFQTFRAEQLCTSDAKKAEYQKKNTGTEETQFEMLKRLELDESAHRELLAYSKRKNLIFISSPFDLTSLSLLERLGIPIIKVPSGEIDNLPYLEAIGRMGKKVILSTGMATLEEVRFAVEVLVKSGTREEDLSILHCTSDYPASMESVNLNAIPVLKKAFPVHVIGYSDHTLGLEVSIAAVAMGARIIERHFTLDRHLPGPDHAASLEPSQFQGMVHAIRNIEKAFGAGEKVPNLSEMSVRKMVRKSIVASKNIKKGEIFSQFNLEIKRPGSGLSPKAWYQVLGNVAKKDFKKDEQISL